MPAVSGQVGVPDTDASWSGGGGNLLRMRWVIFLKGEQDSTAGLKSCRSLDVNIVFGNFKPMVYGARLPASQRRATDAAAEVEVLSTRITCTSE